MKYVIDNDMHIHSYLSICSDDPEQTVDNILKHAKDEGLKTICVTDHYWDSVVPCNTAVNWWYEKQNYDHISKSLPLPQDKSVRFLFGCEADMDSDNVIGIPEFRYKDFGFIIISTTHFHHMKGKSWDNADNKQLAQNWIDRFDAVLDSKLPFHKVGIAHLVCSLINRRSHKDLLETLELIPSTEMERLFSKASKLGMGIELNYSDMSFHDEEREIFLRPFKIAKACSCKFYLGSDAHARKEFDGTKDVFARAIDLIGLSENDKFVI